MTMTLIETKTLTSTQAAIEFTSIPQDATDLLALCSLRENGTDSTRAFTVRINGSDVTGKTLVGNGASASSNTAYIALTNSSTSTSNTFASLSFYIPNYTGTTLKSVSVDHVSENNATTAFQAISAGISAGTAAVTSFGVFGSSASWVSGSTISLYKITKGSSSVVVS